MISIPFKKPFYIIEYQNSVDTLYVGFDYMGYFSTENIENAQASTSIEDIILKRDKIAPKGKILTIMGYHVLEIRK